MTRFGFTIKTRLGQRVDSIQIMAATAVDAERRLRQMYMHCEILECRQNTVPARVEQLDIENIISLISGMPAASAHEPAGR